MMKPVFSLFLIQLFALVLFSACRPESKSDRTGLDDLSLDETEEIADRIDQIKKVYHLCPSPAEMLSIIDVSSVDYLGEVLNPPANAELYFDMKTQAMNLGVYITDLAYTALFGRHQETLDYLETVQSMSEAVRLTGAVDDDLINTARENIDNLDSLFVISNDAFVNMISYCEKNKRPGTIALLSTGAFIESLYLSINMVDSYEEAGDVIAHLAEQKYAIDNLVSYAESLEEDENITSLLNDIEPIREIYNRLTAEGSETTVKKDSSNKLVIGGGKKINMSEQDFNALREAAFSLRARLTGNSDV
jgi:hypothetical protein